MSLITGIVKHALTVEFRYHDKPKFGRSEYNTKKITIGLFDTLEEAVKKGNECLITLAEHFEVRSRDEFRVNGLGGLPDRLVTNTCYPTKGIQYFAQIEYLKFEDLKSTINETFEAFERYKEYKRNEEN